jgi:hypothetical protein
MGDEVVGWNRASGFQMQPRVRDQSRSRAIRSVGARWGRILWRCLLDRQTSDPTLDRRVETATWRAAWLTERVCQAHFTRDANDIVPRHARSMVALAIRSVLEDQAPHSLGSPWSAVSDGLCQFLDT